MIRLVLIMMFFWLAVFAVIATVGVLTLEGRL